MEYIKKHGKEFMCALKTNRLVALTKEDRQKKSFIRVGQIQWSEQQV